MKATIRIGKGSAKHNTHSFESEHIDNEKSINNVYWTYKHGFTEKENLINDEAAFYKENYSEYLDYQNEKYKQKRQYKRIKTIEEYQKATQLDEVLLQVGKMGETIDYTLLQKIVNDFIKQLETKYGKNIHVVSYALHVDEATPHLHLRLAYDYINKDGVKQYGIDKALSALGFKKQKEEFDKNGNKVETESRFNNKKIAFTDKLRSDFYDLVDLHLIETGKDLINRIVENPSHRHLKTELFKAKKQQEANENLKTENNILNTAINQAIQVLEDLKKKNGTAAADADELRSQVNLAKKELEDLEVKSDRLKKDINRKIDKYEACTQLLYDAEAKDLELVGKSPITEALNELERKSNEINNKYNR